MVIAPVRRSRGPAAALAVGVLSVCLVLTGCSDDAPEPAPLESPAASEEPSESPEPSTSPSDGPPLMPEAAKGTSQKSAEAFVRYAVDVLNYSAQNLRSAPLQELSVKLCGGCQSLVSYVDQIRSRSGDVNGGEWTVHRVFVVGRAPTGQKDLVVQVIADAARQEVREAASADTVVHPAGTVSFDFTLTPVRGQWKLRELRQGGR